MTDIKVKAWTYANTTKDTFVQDLQLSEYTIPASKSDHVLVEVLNASLNPGDYKFPFTPIISWLIKRPASPCFDFCGRIRHIPSDLSLSPNDTRNLHVGQVVFGMQRDLKNIGSMRTVMWVAKDAVYPLPSNVPLEHGAAYGIGALTAYQAIAPYANPVSTSPSASGQQETPRKSILINGATGGVGTFCIQIAKALDMYVVATCSSAGTQLCLDLGADKILDYKSPRFLSDLASLTPKVDLVVDNVGHDPEFHRRSEAFLKPEGTFALVGLMAEDWTGVRSMLVSWMLPTWMGGPRRKWKFIFTMSGVGDMAKVAELAEQGKLKVVVDSVFGFGDVQKAFERLKTGRVKGKVLVDVAGYSGGELIM